MDRATNTSDSAERDLLIAWAWRKGGEGPPAPSGRELRGAHGRAARRRTRAEIRRAENPRATRKVRWTRQWRSRQ